MARSRTPPYKDFLQPSLHRRFSSTATVLLILSYLESILLSDWHSFFWAWFPIGPAGVRTLSLFACGLAVLIVRIAHYHVGVRTTRSPIETAGRYLVEFQTIETILSYSFSSLLFTLTFLLSASDRAGLQWITTYSGDRARLNERPLFCLSYSIVGAFVQAIAHRAFDLDRLILGTGMSSPSEKTGKDAVGTLRAVITKMPAILVSAGLGSSVVAMATLPSYYLFLRGSMRAWALWFLRPFFNLPKTNIVPSTYPTDVSLMLWCIYAGSLLTFLWATANEAFSSFMANEPLKNTKPLTAESRDPNGSLLNGLKHKKPSIRSFAMWEAAYLGRNSIERRKAIFEDIDRSGGPAWSQIYAICMDLLKSIEARIGTFETKQTIAPMTQKTSEEVASARSIPTVRQDSIFKSVPPSHVGNKVGEVVNLVARDPGHSPISRLSPTVKRSLIDARDRLLTKDQQEIIKVESLRTGFQQLMTSVFDLPVVGSLFRVGFSRSFTAVVLGDDEFPYADASLYVHAVEVLSQLAGHSLVEDRYGSVQRDVASLVRVFTRTIGAIEGLRSRFPVHWTDVPDARASAQTPEVDAVMAALRSGLTLVVDRFEPFRVDLRLTLTEIRLAREAAATPPGVQDILDAAVHEGRRLPRADSKEMTEEPRLRTLEKRLESQPQRRRESERLEVS